MEQKINANPTKDLFISLLTKDIGLIRAILDLIDNSVDSAIKHSKSTSLEDYSIKINIDKEHFEIIDNCGGMSLNDAKEYAFKFGKDDSHPPSKHSIGRFGVGMKRTIFKLGQLINVKSNAISDDYPYEITIDVEKWKHELGPWEFEWLQIDSTAFKGSNGVIITIDKLYENISEEFSNETFISELIAQIKLAHFIPISDGLSIIVNNIKVPKDVSLVLYSDHEKGVFPQYTCHDIDGVKTSIYCGLADRDKNKAGWYIFCNNRLIVEHNQDELTGWGRGGNRLPKFHANYALFRGYIFFDADDPRLLPWTSTKTSIDRESRIFQKAYSLILRSTKPILAFLRDMAAEKKWMKEEGLSGEERDLESKLKKSVPLIKFSDIILNDTFKFPPIEVPPDTDAFSTLTIARSKKFIDYLKDEFEFTSNKEFAEEIFRYYLHRNGISDETN